MPEISSLASLFQELDYDHDFAADDAAVAAFASDTDCYYDDEDDKDDED